MDEATVKHLLRLNRTFYQTFAVQFSATRQRLQPGVMRILGRIPLNARILDLGCGNGELWQALQRRGQRGSYMGLDFSPELLAEARQAAGDSPQATFLLADLSSPGWEQQVPSGPYDDALAFAVLHHIPGDKLRLSILRKIYSLLSARGRFVHSEWQFLNSPRLRERIQPWEMAGLSPDDVDPGDYLLDWRQGGTGLRYVHHFSLDELNALAEQAGFRIQETFLSDGEGGNLGLYQVWELSDLSR